MKRVITLAAVALCAAGALPLGAGAASASAAHGGDGVLEVEAAHPTSTGVHFIVTLTYQNDGDAVSGAAVTATPISPSGESLDPVTLVPAADGTYQAPVDMPDPGEWTVRFASDEPPATLEQTVEVSDTSTTGADGGSAGFAPADDGTGGSAAADDDSGSDSLPILLIVAAAVVAIGGTITALRIVLRNRPGPGTSTPTDTEPTAPGPTGGAEAGSAARTNDPVAGTSGTATGGGSAVDTKPTAEAGTNSASEPAKAPAVDTEPTPEAGTNSASEPAETPPGPGATGGAEGS